MRGQDDALDFAEFGGGILEGADFSGEGLGVIDGGADLDELLAAVRMAGAEVDLVAFFGFDVSYLSAASAELDEDHGFEAMAEVLTAALIVDRDEP